MTERKRLRIAVQKSGRLYDKSLSLLSKCGLDFDIASEGCDDGLFDALGLHFFLDLAD